MTLLPFVVGLVLGLLLGAVVYAWWQRRRMRGVGPELMPADVPHVVDLLRRAHRAAAACLVVPEGEPVLSSSFFLSLRISDKAAWYRLASATAHSVLRVDSTSSSMRLRKDSGVGRSITPPP